MWIYIFIIIDLTLIALHFIYGKSADFFNLACENNLPTLYQSIKTLITGSLLIVIARKYKLNTWILVAGIIVVYFAFDDWFQIHEKISNYIYLNTFFEMRYRWIIVYLPILTLAVIAFRKIYYKIKMNRLIILGLALLILAFCLEIVEALTYSSQYIFYQVTAEESLEMLGMTAILVAVWGKLKLNFTKNSF